MAASLLHNNCEDHQIYDSAAAVAVFAAVFAVAGYCCCCCYCCWNSNCWLFYGLEFLLHLEDEMGALVFLENWGEMFSAMTFVATAATIFTTTSQLLLTVLHQKQKTASLLWKNKNNMPSSKNWKFPHQNITSHACKHCSWFQWLSIPLSRSMTCFYQICTEVSSCCCLKFSFIKIWEIIIRFPSLLHLGIVFILLVGVVVGIFFAWIYCGMANVVVCSPVAAIHHSG